jgi:hypothetical protein
VGRWGSLGGDGSVEGRRGWKCEESGRRGKRRGGRWMEASKGEVEKGEEREASRGEVEG